MSTEKARLAAAVVLAANSHKASSFLADRLRDGRITSRFSVCVDGEFRVRLVSGVAEFEATGTSSDSEEDALAQAAQVFANWEFQSSVALGGDAIDLSLPV